MCTEFPNIEDIHLLEDTKTDSHGFLGYNPVSNNIVIVFRGTIPWSIKNVIKDFTFNLVDMPLCDNECKVHNGFLQCYTALRDQFWQAFTYMIAKYPEASI